MARQATQEQLNRCKVVPLYQPCMGSSTGQKTAEGCYGCKMLTPKVVQRQARAKAVLPQVNNARKPIKSSKEFELKCGFDPDHDDMAGLKRREKITQVPYDAEKLDFLIQVRELNDTMNAAFDAYRQAHPFQPVTSKNAMKKKKKNRRR